MNIKTRYIFYFNLAVGIFMFKGLISITPEESLFNLIAGNKRFVNSEQVCDPMSKEKLSELLKKGQKPSAVVLSCSDSRVPPEVIFNQENQIGQLFVIRIPGNSISEMVLGSIEFAIKQFETPLILVLGHENCGAVIAAIDSILDKDFKDELRKSHMIHLVNDIIPGLKKISLKSNKADRNKLIENAVKQNVNYVARQLPLRSSIIHDALKENKIRIVGAYYSLENNKIEIV